MYGLDDIKNAKGLHIAHLNVRSIMNKWDAFKAQFNQSNVHILGISESWLNDKIPSSLLTLSNDYTLLRNDRNWNDLRGNHTKKGGGVGLFVNTRLNFCDKIHENLNCSSKDLECQWVNIKQPNSKQIIIGNIYRPPQGNIDNFIEGLELRLSNFNLDRLELFLMGDFNIDMLKKNSNDCRKLIDLIKPLGLRCLIKETTRPSTNRNSCIDQIITNSDTINMSGVIDINLSDHLLIHCNRKKMKLPKTKCNFIGRSYRNYTIEEFQRTIRDANWEPFENSITVTEKWDVFENIIKDNIDRMCPLKHFKINQKKEPWITNELIEIIKDKDLLLKRARKRKDPELWKEAKRLRNQCTARLRNARAEFVKENLNNNLGDQKKFWKNIQEIIPSKKKSQKNSIKLIDKNTGQQVPEDKTTSFINDFFCKYRTKFSQKL